MCKQKKQTFLSETLQLILANISQIINFDFLKDYVGQTHGQHLLAYVAGLILCGTNATMTGIARTLKLCRHDSLERMLSEMNLPARLLSGLFIGWIRNYRRTPGYLMLDDTVLDKRYSKGIDCAGFAWSTCDKRSILGIHIVVMYWSDGKVKIPMGWRLWIPRKKTLRYRTKVDLAFELLADNDEFCKSCQYLTFDSWYCTDRLLRLSSLIGLACTSRLKKNRTIIFKGQEMAVRGLRGGMHQVELPDYGRVSVYCDNSEPQVKYLVCTDTTIPGMEVKKHYERRWRIEESFRYAKQELGLGCCQCRRNTAVRNHISLVLLSHFVMEVLSIRMKVGVYEVSRKFVFGFLGITDDFPDLRQRRAFIKHAA